MGLLPLQAEPGILGIAAPAKAEPSPGRWWEGDLFLPHFHHTNLNWELQRFGERPSEQPMRASPFSTWWWWIKFCPEKHGANQQEIPASPFFACWNWEQDWDNLLLFSQRAACLYSVQICAAWHLGRPRDVIN